MIEGCSIVQNWRFFKVELSFCVVCFLIGVGCLSHKSGWCWMWVESESDFPFLENRTERKRVNQKEIIYRVRHCLPIMNGNNQSTSPRAQPKLTLKDKRKPRPIDVEKAKRLATGSATIGLATPDIQTVSVSSLFQLLWVIVH